MNLGMPEMIFIFLLALVVVGPRKLPELGRQLGKFLAEFKRASNEFKNQLETEMLNIELEERAKKQEEGPKILPPEREWQRPIMPVSGAVSRGNPELVSIEGADSEVMRPLAARSDTPAEEPSSPARSAGSE
ncbi:MAG: twin-arginine translocase TatA/TatE family subunit [Candidatus Korobacteraceae bacterium]